MIQNIPILDLQRFQSDKAQFIEELGKGFQEFGFCGITNHGISAETIDKAYQVFKAFFDLPDAIKNQYIMQNAAGQRGYTAFGTEHAKDNPHMDLKEFWHVGREINRQSEQAKLMEPNFWPEEVKAFQEHAYNLYLALDNLGNTLLQAIALFIGQPQNYFADKVNLGNSILRAIHYPPIDDVNTSSMRAGEHEDINFITLLVGSNEPGLEILSRKGEWIPVTVIEDTIVCNIADMLQRLTNHVLRSTTHRVVNPKHARVTASRFSIPFFLHPNPDFLIQTLDTCICEDNPNRYPNAITADGYLKERLHEIGLM